MVGGTERHLEGGAVRHRVVQVFEDGLREGDDAQANSQSKVRRAHEVSFAFSFSFHILEPKRAS